MSATLSKIAKSSLSKHPLFQTRSASKSFGNVNPWRLAAMHRTLRFIVRKRTSNIADEGTPQRQEEILLSLIRLRSISSWRCGAPSYAMLSVRFRTMKRRVRRIAASLHGLTLSKVWKHFSSGPVGAGSNLISRVRRVLAEGDRLKK